MNYPIQGLAIVAPIIFFVMLIIFPVIGLLKGWKRALFWGAGNFLFYVTGLLVYRFAGSSISNAILPLLKSVLEQFKISTEQITPLAKSLLAPVFFFIVMLVGNLIVMINYLTWGRKVLKVKQENEARKAIKQYKKQQKLAGKDVSKPVTIKLNGQTVTEKSKGYKAINYAGGALALGALMLPVSLSFTNMMFYVTTSQATRKAAPSIVNNLYYALQSADKKMSWFSYYEGKSGEDYNSALALLSASNKKIVYTDASGNQVEGTVVDAITNIATKGMPEVISNLNGISTDTLNDPGILQETLNKTINKFSESWNSIIEAAGDDIEPLFQSENITKLLADIIKSQVTTSANKSLLMNSNDVSIKQITISNALIKQLFVDPFMGELTAFDTIARIYNAGEVTTQECIKLMEDAIEKYPDQKEKIEEIINSWKKSTLEKLTITQLKTISSSASCVANLKETLMNMIKYDEDVTDDYKAKFSAGVDSLVAMFLTI